MDKKLRKQGEENCTNNTKKFTATQFNNKEKVDLKSRFAARKVATTLCSQRFFCPGTKD